jgi:hypothetical protein
MILSLIEAQCVSSDVLGTHCWVHVAAISNGTITCVPVGSNDDTAKGAAMWYSNTSSAFPAI